jgi:hypothetical protein
MRSIEFISETQKLDEVIPLIAKTNSLAQAQAGMKASGRGTIGTVGTTGTQKTVGTPQSGQTINPTQIQAADKKLDQAIRPGAEIPLPTVGTGGPQKFKVTKVQGDEVEVENPEGDSDSTQPKKLTFKKDDVKKSIAI